MEAAVSMLVTSMGVHCVVADKITNEAVQCAAEHYGIHGMCLCVINMRGIWCSSWVNFAS